MAENWIVETPESTSSPSSTNWVVDKPKEPVKDWVVETPKPDEVSVNNSGWDVVAPKDVPKKKLSLFSAVTRNAMKFSPMEQFKTVNALMNMSPEERDKQLEASTAMFKARKFDSPFSAFQAPATPLLKREQEVVEKGTISQFEDLMNVGIAGGLASAPMATAKMLGLFAGQEGVLSLFKTNEAIQSIPDPTIRDAVDMAKFGIEGIIAGKISGVTDLFFQRKKITTAVYDHVDKQIDANAKLTPEQKVQAKKESRPAIDLYLRDVWNADKKYKASLDKTKMLYSDFSDIHKGAIVKNAVTPEGKVELSMMNARPKELVKFDKPAEDILYNALIQMQTAQSREIPMPDAARSHFKRQIAYRLAKGENPAEITQNIANGSIKENNTILVTEATPDFTDPKYSVYDCQQLRLVPINEYAAEKFTQGLTPNDIKIRQQIGGRVKNHTSDLRDNLLASYHRGKKQGLWGPKAPPAAPPQAPGVEPGAPTPPEGTPVSFEEQVKSGTLPQAAAEQLVSGEPVTFENVLIDGGKAETPAKPEIVPPESVKGAKKGIVESKNIWYGTGENSELSNLASRPFSYEGHDYLSVEHAYQTLKSGSFDQSTYGKYTNAGIKIIGMKKANPNTNIALMENLVRESFKQNPDKAALLINTKDSKLTHEQDNGIWKDEFPRILTKIRSELIPKKATLEPSVTIVGTGSKYDHLDVVKEYLNGACTVTGEVLPLGELSKEEKLTIDSMIKSGASREEIHQEILKDMAPEGKPVTSEGTPKGAQVPGTPEYYRSLEHAPLTTFEEQRGWPDRTFDNDITGGKQWYEGDPHENMIRFLYKEIRKEYDKLPEIPKDPADTKDVYFGNDYDNLKASHSKAVEDYAKLYPEVKAKADHLNGLIYKLRNRKRFSTQVKEAQDTGLDPEVKAEFEERMDSVELKEDLAKSGAKGTTANLEDLKILSDELRDWNELLSPYVPQRTFNEPKKSIFSRVKQSKDTFEQEMAKAQNTPEYQAVNEMFLSRVEEVVNRLDPEQLAILEKRTGFDLSKLREKAPEFVKKLDTILSSIDLRLADLQRQAAPWADKELAGGLKFNVQDKIEIPVFTGLELAANESKITLEPGVYDLKDVNGKLTLTVDGVDHIVNEAKWGDILGNPNVEITNEGLDMYCALGPPLSSYGRRLHDKLSPFGKIFQGTGKHPGLRRPTPTRVLLETMRLLRLNPEAKAWVINKMSRGGNTEKFLERKVMFKPAGEQTKELFYQDKISLPALDFFNEIYQRKSYSVFSEIVKEAAAQKELKGPAYDAWEKAVRSLLADASEQVAANETYSETGKWSFTDSASSKHFNKEGVLDPNQAKYYHDRIVKLRTDLGLSIDPAQKTKWADPNGNREPVFWDMLAEVTGNDKLQKWLLYDKSNESVLLSEQLARGIFDKTDIYESQKYGYVKRVFNEKGPQQWIGKNKTSQKSSAETTRRPHAETRNFQEFIARAEELQYTAVDDYFASKFDYTREALYAIHQADTLSKALTHTASLIHTNETFRGLSGDPKVAPIITHKNADHVVAEAAKLSKALGRTVEPDAVLQSWGFLKGREMPGFTDWYKGAWQVPYVYRPVADLFHVMFESSDRGLGVGKAMDVITNAVDAIKFIKTLNPIDTPLIYAAGAYMIRPWRVVNILPKLVGTTVKGAWEGLKIFKGEHGYGMNPEDFPNLDKMIKTGTTGVTFMGSFQSQWDRGRLNHIPELNNFWDNAKEYALSVGGINKAMFEDWIGKEIAGAWEYKYKRYTQQGMTEEVAARRASALMNQMSALLNRGIYGNEAPLLRLSLVSRNLTIAALRNITLMVYSPIKGAMDYSGLYKYHTGQVSRLFNSVMTAEMTPEDRAVISVETWKMVLKLAAAKMVLGGMLQYAMSFQDDNELDEHGEVGNDPSTWKILDKDGNWTGKLRDYPKKRSILENPGPAFMKVRTGDKDAYSKPAYNDMAMFRSVNDLQTLLLGPIPMTNINAGKGRGAVKWATGKQNFWIGTLMNIASNKDMDYGMIYNPKADGWTQFQQGLGYWMQTNKDISFNSAVSMQNKDKNLIYRWYNRVGGQTSFGHATTGIWTPNEWTKNEQAVADEAYLKSKDQAQRKFAEPGNEFDDVEHPQSAASDFLKRNAPEVYFIKQHAQDMLNSELRSPDEKNK